MDVIHEMESGECFQINKSLCTTPLPPLTIPMKLLSSHSLPSSSPICPRVIPMQFNYCPLGKHFSWLLPALSTTMTGHLEAVPSKSQFPQHVEFPSALQP